MKFTLLSGLTFVALATANPIGDELLPRAAKSKCTNGPSTGGGSFCNYTVSCGMQGVTTDTPEYTSKGASLNTCIYNCSTYSQFHGFNCISFNYEIKQKTCSLYRAYNSFTSQTPNKNYDSGTTINC